MRYSAELLDDIRARLPVSQVVARRVQLKRAGREYKGLSPFKVERTPSFFVNDQKGFYHCFASGEHGDIFTFLMKTEGVSFPEAVERLAAEAGVSLPKPAEREAEREDGRARLYGLLEAAQHFYEASLAGPAGAEARRYLEGRGLARETIRRFRLGYAPADRHALERHLAGAGFTREEMVRSGMLIGGEDIAVPYDRFRHRVMFPIGDLKDRPIAFGGRALEKDVPAKYLNSPETPLFHKGAILFNAARARAAAFERKQVIAVEGYMDVVALAEAGIANAVAPLGTALTEDQVRLLWRMAPEPILCFDGDGAGRKAAFRAIDTVLPLLAPGASVTFAFLPDGLDPDDLVRREGPAAMAAVLARARPLADVLFEREWSAGQWSTPERRAQLERQLRTLVARIADPAVRGHYEREMRERLMRAWGREGGFRGGPGRRDGARPGAAPAWKQRTGPATGWAGRAPAPGMPPPVRPSASQSLRQSALAAGAGAAPPYREALLLRALVNHPWLLEEHAEAVAAIAFTSLSLAALRDALLELQSREIALDSAMIRTHLSRSSVSKVLDLVERAITHRSDRFAEPETDRAEVAAGWRHALVLHERQVGLQQELRAAEHAWHTEGSEEALARITEIKRLVECSKSIVSQDDGP
jgi:DNA primase